MAAKKSFVLTMANGSTIAYDPKPKKADKFVGATTRFVMVDALPPKESLEEYLRGELRWLKKIDEMNELVPFRRRVKREC